MNLRSIRVAFAGLLASVLLFGCLDTGKSASPPPALTVVPGDGQVTVTWAMESGVEYWLFYAVGTSAAANSVTATNFAKINVSSPLVVTGLTNGTTYAFTMSGRVGGGPGGARAPIVTSVPRAAGIVWTSGAAMGANMRGVTYGAASTGVSYYDAVGDGGAMFQSLDGLTWNAVTAATGNWVTTAAGNNFNAALYARSKFFVASATGQILSSADNLNWTVGTYNTPPGVLSINALASNGARIVAVANSGQIFYSDDIGITWTTATVPGAQNLYGVTYSASGRWVAVGATGVIVTSTDGATWTATATVAPPIATDLTGVAVLPAGNVFAAVGAGGKILTSSDGLTWTSQTVAPANDLTAVTASTAGTVQFLAVGKSGTAFTSPDAVTWAGQTTGTTGGVDLLAVNNALNVITTVGQFVAVGTTGANVNSR